MKGEIRIIDSPSTKINWCEICQMPLDADEIVLQVGTTEVIIPNANNPKIKLRYVAHSVCQDRHNEMNEYIERFRNAKPEDFKGVE